MITDGANDRYALRLAAERAATDVRKVLPPLMAEVVAAEIRWLKESAWAANYERLKAVIAEVDAPGDAEGRMNAKRLELFLIAQMRLRAARDDRLMEFEVGKAIEEECSGCSCSHTDTIENWCVQFLGAPA